MSSRFADDRKPDLPLAPSVQQAVHELIELMNDDAPNCRLPHDACSLCGGTDAFLIARKDRHGIPVETLICKACGLVFSATRLSDRFAARYYGTFANRFKNLGRSPREMFELRTASGAYCWTRQRFVRAGLGADRYARIKTVVEIGCNDGCNLYPYMLDGKEVIGCDFDEARLDAGRVRGVRLLTTDVDGLIGLGIQADLVILSHVLEHVHEPDEFVARVRHVMAPGSWLYVEVPGLRWSNRQWAERRSIDGYGGSNNVLGYLQFEHNYCFELATLRAVVERHGFSYLTGDEVIRALFSEPGEGTGARAADHQAPDSYGAHVLADLRKVEADFQKRHVRRALRHLKRRVHIWLN